MLKLNNKPQIMFSSEVGSKLYDRILATVKKENMLPMIEGGVLIGFSGGADSVFLLCFLHELKRRTLGSFPILAVHVNHGIRGEEASRDEMFSKNFASELGVEFISRYIDVPKISKDLGIGIEEAARNARYSVFNELIKSRIDLSTISVAHNASDNAETVLLNIMRGCGISGICGIKPTRDNIIRPIISVSKREIVNLLENYDIPYVTDSTNLSSDYARNYVRNEIMPHFNRMSSNPEAAFTRMIDNLRLDLDYLNGVAEQFIEDNFTGSIGRNKLKDLHPAVLAKVLSSIIHSATGEYPEEKHIKAITNLLNSDNFKYSLPGAMDIVCERGICFFQSKDKKNNLSEQIFCLNYGENKISGTNLTVFIGEIDKSSLFVYKFSIQAFVSSAIIDDGLTLRFKTDGDSYRYGNMTHKLKKVFNDRNIPTSERERIPLILDSNGIVVVPGMSERDGAKSKSEKNIPITFAYADPRDGETEVFTALLRK